VAHSRKQSLRYEAGDHERKPVQSQHQQSRCRADSQALDQKKRKPAGYRPLVAEMEKQQQAEEDSAGNRELSSGFTHGSLAGARLRWKLALCECNRRQAWNDRDEKEYCRNGVNVERPGDRYRNQERPEAKK
jgi:hypothetical protein